MTKVVALVPRTIAVDDVDVLCMAIGTHGVRPKCAWKASLERKSFSTIHGATNKPLGTSVGLWLTLGRGVMYNTVFKECCDQFGRIVGPSPLSGLTTHETSQGVGGVRCGFPGNGETVEPTCSPIAENHSGLVAGNALRTHAISHDVVGGDLVAKGGRTRSPLPVLVVLTAVRCTLTFGNATSLATVSYTTPQLPMNTGVWLPT